LSLAVLGLGKLGSILAVVLAEAGHAVKGFDVSLPAVEALNNSKPLIFEPGLVELMESVGGQVSAHSEVDRALEDASGAYVIVPTPSNPQGAFKNDFVVHALRDIGNHLAKNPRDFTIVISSTVMPGSCEDTFRQELETASGMTVGKELGLAYSPEFIALGSAIHDMKYPDLVLIGESHAAAGDFVEEVSRSVVKNKPQFRRMSLSSAELTKIAINTFVTTKISYANMLSEICEQLPGASIDDVTAAVGSDLRIGKSYLTAGLGYGGPCFPRDNKALSYAAHSRGVSADIAEATDAINDRQIDRVVDLAVAHTLEGETVALMGLAYKSDTPVLEASQAMEIARRLVTKNRVVLGFDPLVSKSHEGSPLDGVLLIDDARQIGPAALLIVCTRERLTESIPREYLPKLIIDLFGANGDDELEVIRPGVGPGIC
jgi:UDPglucose 6-dehydrogenase